MIPSAGLNKAGMTASAGLNKARMTGPYWGQQYKYSICQIKQSTISYNTHHKVRELIVSYLLDVF